MGGSASLEALLKLLEALKSRAKEQSAWAEADIEKHVRPLMELAKVVFEDYMNMFYELRRRFEGGETREELIKFLEKRRLENLAARGMLRAEAYESIADQRFGQFECGMLGLVVGALRSYEKQEPAPAFYFRGHTLLDVLSNLQYGYAEPPERFGGLLTRQEEALQRAWSDITQGFAALTSSVRRKRAS